MVKVTIVISAYNYGSFISECLDSVLNQSYKNIAIIVVDDGSTDATSDIIKQYNHNVINYISKPNGGQLSCFNAAVPYVDGDYVFFLDADDVYQGNYIEKAVNFYRENPFCDFLFCEQKFIDRGGHGISINNKRIFPLKKYYGYTPVITYVNKLWIGAPTSCISIRKSLLKKILPIPHAENWRIRADDCLVWGASLKLGYKCFLKEPLVKYRIHGNNQYFGQNISKENIYLRNFSINKLFKFLTKDDNISNWGELISKEFASLPEKTIEDARNYLIALSNINISSFVKIVQALSIMKHYITDIQCPSSVFFPPFRDGGRQ